jgi:hypothetical protein
MRSVLFFSLLAIALLSVPAGSGAQQTEADAPETQQGTQQHTQLAMELNRMQQGQEGCRLSFIAVNRMGASLETTAMEVVFFNASGVVSEMLLLDFGRLPQDKTKVVEFVLQQQQCDDISRVLVNDVVECSSGGEHNMTQECFSALTTSNRTEIEFGV